MGGYSSYYKGERKKLSKVGLEKRVQKVLKVRIIPRVQIISKKKKK